MKNFFSLKNVIIFLILTILTVISFFVYESVKFDKYVSTKFTGDFNVPVNDKAPVISSDQIAINAPQIAVWEALSNIEEWPNWQTDITEAKLLGKLEEGVIFEWKAGGLSFDSQIHTIKKFSRLGWIGKTFGAYAVHNWEIEGIDSLTTVKVYESLQGVFPTLMSGYFTENLKEGMKKNLTELKKESERIYREK